jgi:hypothetical protein
VKRFGVVSTMLDRTQLYLGIYMLISTFEKSRKLSFFVYDTNHLAINADNFSESFSEELATFELLGSMCPNAQES